MLKNLVMSVLRYLCRTFSGFDIKAKVVEPVGDWSVQHLTEMGSRAFNTGQIVFLCDKVITAEGDKRQAC